MTDLKVISEMLSELQLDKINNEESTKRYLFVCTGNTCRSPMAEAVFNKLYKDSGIVAESCGLMAGGAPLSENARLALEEIGIFDFHHISRQISEELLFSADLIIGMTGEHAARLMMAFPAYATKITVMPLEIEDPYGGDLEIYKICLSQICEALSIGFSENYEDENN